MKSAIKDMTKAERTTLKLIQQEMTARRHELITQQKRNGGVAAIRLKSENVQFCYDPKRKRHEFNPRGEKYFLTGVMLGMPVIVNESEVREMLA